MRKADSLTELRSLGSIAGLWLGAVSGALVWSSYAVLEQIFIVAPAIAHGSSAPHVWPSYVAFASLAMVGVGAGTVTAGLCMLAARAWPQVGRLPAQHVMGAGAAITLIAAFFLNLLMNRTAWQYLWPELVLAAGLAAAAVASVVPDWRRYVLVLATPWSLSTLLLGLSFVLYVESAPSAYQSAIVRFGVAAIAVLLLSVAFGRTRWAASASRGAMVPWRAIASRLVAFSAVLAAGTLGSGRSEAAAGPARAASAKATDGRPNVVLIVMDTVGARHMSLYGYHRPTTPRIDMFARQASVYDRAIAPGNMTLTSHSSLFTGLYANRHGALPPFGVLSAAHTTMAELLAREGYVTAGVVANHGYLDDSFGLARGFQHWNQRATALPVAAREPYFLRRRLVRVGRTIVQTAAPLPRYPLASEITPEVLQRLEMLASEKRPFFLFVNYMDTHEPYDAGPPFNSLFGKPLPTERWISPDRWAGAKLTRTPEGRQRLAAMYDGAIVAVDSAVGKILDRLKALNQYENALIIVTSDHGEAFGEGNAVGHGGVHLGQAVIHVPLVIKYPHDDRPERVRPYVSLVDLFPTILDVLQLPERPQLQGVSLLKQRRPDDVISEGIVGELGKHESSRAIIADGMKLVMSNVAPPELYDLSADPGEHRNLYKPDDPRSSAMARRMDEWLGSGRPRPGEQPAPDAEALERLKALGYVR